MNNTATINLEDIGESLGKFRIVNPSAERRMFESMKEVGQLSPVIVAESVDQEPMELIDGFKRLVAARNIPEIQSLFAHTLPVRGYAQKALILKLNWKSSHLRPLEEAAIIQSLHREDGLEQLAIAKLLGRHPSWVCRRLSLAEHLHEEVKNHMDIGLIPASFGRELAKLPRGNQEEVLKCLVKHRFSQKEVEKLVRHLLKEPSHSWPKILYSPWELIHRESSAKTSSPPQREITADFENKLIALEALCSEFAGFLEQTTYVPDTYITRIRQAVECICNRVEDIETKRKNTSPCVPF